MDEKRVNKALKICRKYLHWVQNSVFEGEITVIELKKLKHELKEIIQDKDNIRIYTVRAEQWIKKEVLGEIKANTSSFI
ncbi:CRISPR-associated endonuclease Cas2 [Chondrinema litorale]|uniref:CRISPR-associated endonuclease Cas2 n=1 Tax=Chondrinema litorale TaxID=2994555 RepID=UPI003D6E689B